jgi:hypothetical protein
MFEENQPLFLFVHHKSHNNLAAMQPVPQLWEADD